MSILIDQRPGPARRGPCRPFDAPARTLERCGGSAVRPHELPAVEAADLFRSSEVSMHER